jgi:hypothetical protein
MQNHLHGCEDLEVKEEKDRPDEDWFSLVDAEIERSFRRPLAWKLILPCFQHSCIVNKGT